MTLQIDIFKVNFDQERISQEVEFRT